MLIGAQAGCEDLSQICHVDGVGEIQDGEGKCTQSSTLQRKSMCNRIKKIVKYESGFSWSGIV